MARSLAARGMDCLLIDHDTHPANNIARPKIASEISCIFDLFDVHGFDLPCCTWSRARRAPKWSSFPSPLRSAAYLMGLPDLGDKDQQKVALHNMLFRRTIQWAKLSIRNGCSGYIENPYPSMLWLTKQVKSLCRMGATFVDFEFCQYGRNVRKRTKLLAWGPAFDGLELRICEGKQGVCSRTHRKHITLTGVANGRFLSSLAQVYSREFTDAVASQLYKSASP